MKDKARSGVVGRPIRVTHFTKIERAGFVSQSDVTMVIEVEEDAIGCIEKFHSWFTHGTKKHSNSVCDVRSSVDCAQGRLLKGMPKRRRLLWS